MRARPVRARANLYARAARNGSENACVKLISAHVVRDFGARVARAETAPQQKKRRNFWGAPRRDFARCHRRGRPRSRYVALRGGPVPGEAGAEKARARARGVSRKAGATRRRPRKRAPLRREFAGPRGRNAPNRTHSQNACDRTNPTQNTVHAINVRKHV